MFRILIRNIQCQFALNRWCSFALVLDLAQHTSKSRICTESCSAPRQFVLPSASSSDLCRLDAASGFTIGSSIRLPVKNKCEGLATKHCTQNGTWYINPSSVTWTNSTQCESINLVDINATIEQKEIDEIYQQWIQIILNTTYVGYGLSILGLMVSVLIFVALKRLHCERNKLHTNLFISYTLNAIMYILKSILFWEGLVFFNDVTCENGIHKVSYTWTCKTFITIQNYLSLTNYMMMLMEGLYLHNLIFLNLISESHGTNIYCVLGWGIPVAFITPWIVLRLKFENNYCWTDKDGSFITALLQVPVGVTVIINFILFSIIVGILVLKMHFSSVYMQHKKFKYRKLLKSTLILIPLYGIPYAATLALSFQAPHNKILEIVWLFCDQTFTSFQGLFAALVYCLLNGDVQTEILRRWSLFRDQSNGTFRRNRTISSNTQQFSLQNHDKAMEKFQLFGIVDDATVKKTSNE